MAEARISPLERRWLSFRELCDELNIWAWPHDCYDQAGEKRLPDVDGTNWELNLFWDGNSIQSHGGTGGVPENGFKEFLQGLNELLGLPDLVFRDAEFADEE